MQSLACPPNQGNKQRDKQKHKRKHTVFLHHYKNRRAVNGSSIKSFSLKIYYSTKTALQIGIYKPNTISSPSISDSLSNPNDMYNRCAFVLDISVANLIHLCGLAVFKMFIANNAACLPYPFPWCFLSIKKLHE